MNYRHIWENQDGELRKAVIRDLYEWRRYFQGGLPDLDYPHKEPYYAPPRYPDQEAISRPPEPDEQKAKHVEDTLVLWRLIMDSAEAPESVKGRLRQLLDALLLRFREGMHARAVARQLKVSERHAYRLIDESLYRFWVISQ